MLDYSWRWILFCVFLLDSFICSMMCGRFVFFLHLWFFRLNDDTPGLSELKYSARMTSKAGFREVLFTRNFYDV